MEAQERIIVALDVDSPEKALKLVEATKGKVGCYKIGLEFINSMLAGIINPKLYSKSVTNLGKIHGLFKMLDEIFWDGKFSDIPNTVSGAVKAVGRISGVRMLNVHCLGGPEMMSEAIKAAEEIAEETGSQPLVLGVTILTSLNFQDLEMMGIVKTLGDLSEEIQQEIIRKQVEDLAVLAEDSGLDGVICSPKEIKVVRGRCGPNFLIVTPGIRPVWTQKNDQKRIMTPKEAIAAGADYLVIGRPITKPPDDIGNPGYAATSIAQEIEEGLEERKQ